ncbi:MAG: DUF5685 family protein [Clostridiales Family XIII bacterium]|jgi:hypothetical protein|nr:DUF5685 family protein [Clostridiales Family XIII bacterium]
MLGYVTPEKGELRLREFEVYGAYYCGICRSTGARYGQLPRLFLRYDFVFLAMLLSSMSSAPDAIRPFRCPVHPTRKRVTLEASPAIDYAADMMVLSAYYKLRDDRLDAGSPRGFAGEILLRGAVRKVRNAYPDKSREIDACMRELVSLEKEGCASFDRAAEPFARFMGEMLDYDCDAPVRAGQSPQHADNLRYALRRIGRSLGKWLCLIDAYDDAADDLRRSAYNPLALCYGYGQAGNEGENAALFRERIAERVRLSAMLYLSEIAEIAALLPIGKNKEILENIIYMGLLRRTEEIVSGNGKKRTTAQRI